MWYNDCHYCLLIQSHLRCETTNDCYLTKEHKLRSVHIIIQRTTQYWCVNLKAKGQISFLKTQCQLLAHCFSNKKLERLVGPLYEIVTVSVQEYNVIIPCPNMTS